MTRLGQMLMEDGIEEGIEKTRTESIQNLMKNTNWTLEHTMNMLEIPAECQEKYRQLFNKPKA